MSIVTRCSPTHENLLQTALDAVKPFISADKPFSAQIADTTEGQARYVDRFLQPYGRGQYVKFDIDAEHDIGDGHHFHCREEAAQAIAAAYEAAFGKTYGKDVVDREICLVIYFGAHLASFRALRSEIATAIYRCKTTSFGILSKGDFAEKMGVFLAAQEAGIWPADDVLQRVKKFLETLYVEAERRLKK
ncbi:hypothetical protein A3J11_00715 [Candidatus Kaiserbacteria bacterium RIFCSPLOWO2_02_FULL_55_12]|uniref:Uncharacterized protein n=2 Tax=Candidatus Kaiseribacteriota TaxID=1752734 RepID=A0A1F6EZ16_9BACT|nr:MAG: hypothetical protein A3C94_02995 [Candidatus Kaiserbacteria bacterium RIFCSPHIGHO2_02_FULL_55_17]OGG78857.1 MAG: hypothetical protein A3J11_00715 [Candidatus Kaiserbacteria bacterium RIFCSPLOWO2_02_FULL_55_12]